MTSTSTPDVTAPTGPRACPAAGFLDEPGPARPPGHLRDQHLVVADRAEPGRGPTRHPGLGAGAVLGRAGNARRGRGVDDGGLATQPRRYRHRPEQPDLTAGFDTALPDWQPADVVGSPYCIRDYLVDDSLGGTDGLAAARSELAARGIGLILDFRAQPRGPPTTPG